MTTKTTTCEGHPAGPYDPMGETVYCDGSCNPTVTTDRDISGVERVTCRHCGHTFSVSEGWRTEFPLTECVCGRTLIDWNAATATALRDLIDREREQGRAFGPLAEAARTRIAQLEAIA